MKPILFNTEMVKAILDGRKTVTRRVIKEIPNHMHYGKRIMDWDLSCVGKFENGILNFEVQCDADDSYRSSAKSPYKVGDILYVRETFQLIPSEVDDGIAVVYKASENGKLWQDNSEDWTWRPSLHMPKEAARIFLKVTNVRVERLQDITPEQALKEGIKPFSDDPIDCVHDFGYLWDSTVKKTDLDRYGWHANPWVWVIAFERCEKEAE